VAALQGDEHLVLTGASAARPYGWHELSPGQPWAPAAYLQPEALGALLDQFSRAADAAGDGSSRPVLLRTIEGDWPFPSQYQLAPQPLAALDLLDYSDPAARQLGREVLRSLADTPPTVVARRTARGAHWPGHAWETSCEQLATEARARSPTAIRAPRHAPPRPTSSACCTRVQRRHRSRRRPLT